MNITEEKIWQQFGAVPDAITLTDQMAKDIANALNATHKNSRTAIKDEMAKYEVAILGLEKKISQLVELLSTGAIDKFAYDLKYKTITDDHLDLRRKLEQSQLAITDGFMETAQTILELAIDAKQLWKIQNEYERLDFLKKVCSNPVLNSTTIEYDLKKPYSILSKMRENQEWCTRQESNLKPLESKSNTLSN